VDALMLAATDFAPSDPHPLRQQQNQTKVLAGHRIWLANKSRNMIIRSFQKTYLRRDCNGWRFAAAVAGNRTTFFHHGDVS
jgi:hypothetical protein